MTVVGVKSPGSDFTYATTETVLHDDDIVLVSGASDALERFARLK